MAIVSAVGIAVGGKRRMNGSPLGPSCSMDVQHAMEQAVLSSVQQGITDPREVRAMMNEARKRIKTAHGQTMAEVEAEVLRLKISDVDEISRMKFEAYNHAKGVK